MSLLKFDKGKHLALWNKAVLGVLLLFAVYFFVERTTTLDASFQGSLIYFHKTLAIQVERFGAAFVQAFALAGTKLGLPLKWTLILYSSSFVIEACLVYWVLSKLLKLEGMATALTIYLTVFVGHTFFWAQSELLQANVLVILYGGLLYYWKDNMQWWQVPIFGVFSVVLTYLHPLAFIPMFFMLGFVWLSTTNKRQLAYYATALVAAAAWIWKQFLVTKGDYDEVAIGHAGGLLSRIPEFFDLYSTRNFWDFVVADYFVFPFLFLLGIVFYIKKKEGIKLIWFVGFVLGTLVLINGSYHWDIKQFYIESFYRVMVVMVGVVIGIDVLSDASWRRWMIGAVLPVVFILRLVAIWNKAPIYTERVVYNKQLIQIANQLPGQKFIMKKSDAPATLPHNHWSIAYETLLLSALEGRDEAVTVLITADDDYRTYMDKYLQVPFMDAFQAHDYNLPTQYFNLDPDEKYRLITREDVEKLK